MCCYRINFMAILSNWLVEHAWYISTLFFWKFFLYLDVLKIKNKFPVLLFPPALENIKSSNMNKTGNSLELSFQDDSIYCLKILVKHFTGRTLLKTYSAANCQFLTLLCLLSTPLKILVSVYFSHCGMEFLSSGRVLQTVITKNKFQ